MREENRELKVERNRFYEEPWLMKRNLISYLIPGGNLLDRFYGIRETGGRYSQAWLCSVVNSAVNGTEGVSMVECQDGCQRFTELIDAAPEAVFGKAHTQRWGKSTGVLIKLLNSRDRLLIQAHPDKTMAKQYFHSDFGKTECWYVLELDEMVEEPCIYAGFREGVTREQFRALIEKQDTAGLLNCLHRFPLERGQVILIPAGLPHALGEGSLVVEIQEPVDITLRAEYIRPDGSRLPKESMHQGIGLEAMLDCFDLTARTRGETEDLIMLSPERLTETEEVREEALAGPPATDCFSMHRVEMLSGKKGHKSSEERQNNPFTSILVLSGEGWLTAGEKRVALQRGMELFLPHGVKTYAYETDSRLELLEFYPPELTRV